MKHPTAGAFGDDGGQSRINTEPQCRPAPRARRQIGSPFSRRYRIGRF